MNHSRRLVAIVAAAAAAGALEFAVPGAVAPKVAHAASTLKIAGDFNGDGHADLAVADASTGGSDRGQVFVYYGGPNGLDTSNPQEFDATTTGMPSQLATACGIGCGFGFSVVSGYFSGGTYSDLAIGLADAVVILHGGPQGLSTQGSQFIAAPSSLAACCGTGFGWALASGDFNHDGFGDLAISSPFANLGSIHRVGAVTIMYGSASGLTGAQTVVTQATPGIAGPAAAYDDGFGWNMAVGDFKHNGFSDLAIAVPHEAGDVVLYGSAAGLTTAGSQYLQGAGGQAYQVAAGDFNGNGYDDLAVGESCISTVEIHYGGASGLGSVSFKTAQEITPTKAGMPAGAANGLFGETLAVGDIKHNGRADLVVGGSNVGPIAVWGTSTKLTTKGSAVVGSGLDNALTDLNGDGYADLVSYWPFTGSPSQPAVFDGSRAGVVHTPSTVLGQQMLSADSVRGVTSGGDQACGGP